MKFGNFLIKIEMLERTAEMRGVAWRFIAGVLKSRYFLFSLIFYLVLLLVASGVVVSQYIVNKSNFDEGTALISLPEYTPPPPVQQQKPTTERTETTREVTTASAAANVSATARRLMVNAPSTHMRPPAPSFVPAISPSSGLKIETDIVKNIRVAEVARLLKVRDLQSGWKVEKSGKDTKAVFTVFKARYQDGDWNCNPADLNNMMLQIRRWSKDAIKANVHPKVLDIGTDDLFTIKPPFVYLTGHRDFHFLDREVTNLRDYLLVGGCVWADSALAGRRSRFDMAFRHEMKRVLPDRDFETVEDNHEMFDTFFDRISLPPGMNYYYEPSEMINIGGELAVLYTLNGYGHFWEARLNQKGTIERNAVRISKPGERPIRWSHVYGPHLGHPLNNIIYRNMNDDTTQLSYKFGINVVVHLLTRYQEKLRALPIDLNSAMEDLKLKQREKTTEELWAEEDERARTEKEKAAQGVKTATVRTVKMSGSSNIPTIGPKPTIGIKKNEDKQ